MKQITKKYIFKCKLKGEPIDLSFCAGKKKEWEDAVRQLIKFEILTEDQETPNPNDIEFLKDPKAGAYYLHYPIKAKFRDNDDDELTTSIVTPRRVLVK